MNILRKHFRSINKYLSSLPLVGSLFRFARNCFLSSEGRKNWRINDWVSDSLKMIERYGLVEFRFGKDGAFIVEADGLEYWFDPLYASGRLQEAIYEATPPSNKKEIDLLLTHIEDGSTFLDIGAGIGKYALNIAAKRNVMVFAFEPTSETYKSLQINVERSGRKNITSIGWAIADRFDMLPLLSVYDGNHLVDSENRKRLKKGNFEIVEVTTVDDFISKYSVPYVSAIKADIEGAELLMLHGAENCLKTQKPYLLLEIVESATEKMGYKSEEIFKYLDDLGYVPVPIEESENVFFYHRDKGLKNA